MTPYDQAIKLEEQACKATDRKKRNLLLEEARTTWIDLGNLARGRAESCRLAVQQESILERVLFNEEIHP